MKGPNQCVSFNVLGNFRSFVHFQKKNISVNVVLGHSGCLEDSVPSERLDCSVWPTPLPVITIEFLGLRRDGRGRGEPHFTKELI